MAPFKILWSGKGRELVHLRGRFILFWRIRGRELLIALSWYNWRLKLWIASGVMGDIRCRLRLVLRLWVVGLTTVVVGLHGDDDKTSGGGLRGRSSRR